MAIPGKVIDQFEKADSPFIEIRDTRVRTMDDLNAGSNAFGKVLEGMPMGVITATKKIRPCLNTVVDGDQSAVTEIDVDDATAAFIGDLIDIISQGKIGTKTFNANAVPETITLTGRNKDALAHSVQLVDPAAADQPMRAEVTEAAGVRACKIYLETGGGAVGTKVFEANAVPESITLTGLLKDGLAHTVQLINPSANDAVLRVEATVAAGVYTIKVYLATGGAGAITSTPADVCAALNAAVGHILVATYDATTTSCTDVAAQALAGGSVSDDLVSTPADVVAAINAAMGDVLVATYSATTTPCTAVAAQALANGVAEDALVLDGVAITAVDKVSAQHTITTGTTVNVQDGDILRLDNGAQTCLGLLTHDANTHTGLYDEDNDPILQEPSCTVALSGIVDESLLPVTLSDAQKADLSHFIFE